MGLFSCIPEPLPLEDIAQNLVDLVPHVEGQLKLLMDGCLESNDFDSAVTEKSLEAIYGKDFFDWYNANFDEE